VKDDTIIHLKNGMSKIKIMKKTKLKASFFLTHHEICKIHHHGTTGHLHQSMVGAHAEHHVPPPLHPPLTHGSPPWNALTTHALGSGKRTIMQTISKRITTTATMHVYHTLKYLFKVAFIFIAATSPLFSWHWKIITKR